MKTLKVFFLVLGVVLLFSRAGMAANGFDDSSEGWTSQNIEAGPTSEQLSAWSPAAWATEADGNGYIYLKAETSQKRPRPYTIGIKKRFCELTGMELKIDLKRLGDAFATLSSQYPNPTVRWVISNSNNPATGEGTWFVAKEAFAIPLNSIGSTWQSYTIELKADNFFLWPWGTATPESFADVLKNCEYIGLTLYSNAPDNHTWGWGSEGTYSILPDYGAYVPTSGSAGILALDNFSVYRPGQSFDDFNLVDQTPTSPLAQPDPSDDHARYLCGFGKDSEFTIFFEDRKDGGRIKFVHTEHGPGCFPERATATNINDTHFLVKPWPISVSGASFAYRAWASVGNNEDHHFYVANDLDNWTLVSTFQIPNTPSLGNGYGYVYYGFHDVIKINGTYYAFAETNTGHTVIVRSSNGDDQWEAFAHMGGIGGQCPLGTPWGATGWTGRGNFFDLGNDRGMGKLYIDPRDTTFYLAINTEAKASLPPDQLEAAFINPDNWTWRDGTTGAPTGSAAIATATSGHDLKEGWLLPRSRVTPDWTIIYDANFPAAGTGGKNLGYYGPATNDLAVTKEFITGPPYVAGDTVEYRIRVTNLGNKESTNIILTDFFTNQGDFVIEVDENPTGAGIACNCLGTSPCSCSIDRLGRDEYVVFKARGKIAAVGNFTNLVEVTADQFDCNLPNNRSMVNARAESPSVPTLGEAAAFGLLLLLTVVALYRRNKGFTIG